MNRRLQPAWGLRAKVTAAAILSLASCAQAYDVPVSTPQAPSAALTKLPRKRLERRLVRHAAPARHVVAEVTLWDDALILADRTGEPVDPTLASGITESPQEAADRMRRWASIYTDDHTTFTVVLELANRPPVAKGQIIDPLADPLAWTFDLQVGDGPRLEPSKVAVQAVDRFPTRGGGHHWRLAMTVSFEEGLWERVESDRNHKRGEASLVRLRVQSHARDRGRAILGKRLDKEGFALRWWVKAPEASAARAVASK